MNTRKNVVIISASPKVGEPSASEMLAQMAERQMDPNRIHLTKINVRRSISAHREAEDFPAIDEADAVVLIFPLYFFCLPGLLMRYLEDYHGAWLKNGGKAEHQKIYAAVNCGFPEAGINEEALRVVKSFSRQIGADFRFGIQIGGGGMLLGAKDAPFMKKSMNRLNELWDRILEDILEENKGLPENVKIEAPIPHKLYFWMGGMGFRHTARKNGLSKPDLLRRPYRKTTGEKNR